LVKLKVEIGNIRTDSENAGCYFVDACHDLPPFS